MKLAIIFFSATNNTKVMSEIIRKEFETLGASADMYDITTLANRQNTINFAPYDAVLFGIPVHSLRAPKIVREWLLTLDGDGKKCSMFFTYGGFTVHPAHHSTREILKEQNFTVVSSVEFPGAHTFNIGGWRALEKRPDIREFELAHKYTIATYKRFAGEDDNILGKLDENIFSEEQLDQFEAFRFKAITKLPGRNGKECCMCKICEKTCPTGAMNSETGEADMEKCIACLRCVASCPDQVLTINSTAKSWKGKLDMGKTNEIEINKQTGKIYL